MLILFARSREQPPCRCWSLNNLSSSPIFLIVIQCQMLIRTGGFTTQLMSRMHWYRTPTLALTLSDSRVKSVCVVSFHAIYLRAWTASYFLLNPMAKYLLNISSQALTKPLRVIKCILIQIILYLIYKVLQATSLLLHSWSTWIWVNGIEDNVWQCKQVSLGNALQ